MITRDILKSHPLSTLKKEISKYNKLVTVSGYSKMKKGEVIDLMMKHPNKFKHIKMKEKAQKKPLAEKKKQTQKEIKEFEKSLAKELEDPKKFNELFGDLPKKKKPKKIIKKSKPVEKPKAEKPKPKVSDAKLKKLKKELKSKGVPARSLKFINTVKAAQEKLDELDEPEDDKSVIVDPIYLKAVPAKDRKEVTNLVKLILPRDEYDLGDQRDYFDDLKDMAEDWPTSAKPRIKYEENFDAAEKELFKLLYPKLFAKKSDTEGAKKKK